MLLRILIADDDMEICNLWHKELCKRFAEEGQEVEIFEAYDGCEAFEVFEKVKPNFVILDVMMPVQNGWETCRRIRYYEQTHPKFPPSIILIVSGIGPQLNEMTSPLYGADDYMDKPLEKKALFNRMKHLLENKK